MIESLDISNYALIDHIALRFTPGLNIITGETGAGKSIMLGALSMLLGNRADTRVVADKSKKSVVEAVFEVSGYPALKQLLEENDIDADDSRLIMRREITPQGRSRSFINDVPVQLTTLRDVAVRLVDIHSQHQNLLLATREYQLGIIDTLLPDRAPLDRYAEAYEAYRKALRKYSLTKRAIESSRAEEEYFRYQLEQLDALNPLPGEFEEIEAERNLLADMTGLKMSFASLISLFSGDEGHNIVDSLRTASSEIVNLRAVDEAASLEDRIESLRIEAADIASTLEAIDSRLEANPRRLEQLEERISDYYRLQHKFGTDEPDGLVNLREELRTKLDAIDNGESLLRTVTAAAKSAKKAALAAAAELTEARRAVASRFAETLRENAVPLGMKNLQVEVAFTPEDLSPTGTDAVDFLFAFNKNQPLMPVKDTASGGEISRLMLVIKAILAGRMQLPSIIFDEIDTGVSGDVANRMGELMKAIADDIQVIAITHLPQVASKGDSHFKVYKEDSDTATNTRVTALDREGRIGELALMLSGDADNESARRTAGEMLDKNK